MSLKHTDIWRAIDRLAEQNGLSPSGLARKAGLSPTVFNMSKRISASRKRWPSTESLAQILKATDTKLDDFVALASPEREAARRTLPMIPLEAAQTENAFDDDGLPSSKAWEDIALPSIDDPKAFALEITGEKWEPVYRSGDRLILSAQEKPRRGDRVAVRTTKNEIHLGLLGREGARSVEIVAQNPSRAALALAPGEIEWMRRIIWASQ